jgi:carbonic anhydrase/acetyltransferase-like protein (isoleucine patch superfamily)
LSSLAEKARRAGIKRQSLLENNAYVLNMGAILITIKVGRSLRGSIMAIRTYQQFTPLLGSRAFVDASAVVLGDVEIGADSSVWPLVVIRGDMHSIRIGERSSIQDGSVLHITHAGPFNPRGYPLNIGDDVTIAHNVTLHGCSIGNRVLIGMGSIVMDGAVIDDEVMLGAGSLVPPGSQLQSGYLYLGSPAKQARELSEKERSYFRYSADNYVRLKDQHLMEGYGS